MEITTIKTTRGPGRQAAINGLAIVGFVALVLIGMALAVYAARFVPAALSRIGGAAVYLSSVFSPAEEPGLEVIAPDTTVPFGDDTVVATSTSSTATSTPPEAPAPAANPSAVPVAGAQTTTTYQIAGGTQAPAPLSGLPDLAISNVAAGYCTSSSPSSFKKSSEVPDGERGGVSFTTTNRGTNVSGKWKFDAVLPTSPSYTFTSPSQETLRPGERIDSTFCFDRPKSGDDREIAIRLDADKDIKESDEGNNNATVSIDIED